jgi:hypothetical protein
MKLQATINEIDDWAKKWRIKIKQSNSTNITSTLRNQTCPTVQMGSVDLPQRNELKYLSMHFARSLTWAKHIKTKRKQLNQKAKQTHWLLGRINTINRKQTPPMQSSTRTHVNLWNSAVGDSLQFQYRNPPGLPIQDSPIHFERTWHINNHKIHGDLHMSTVLSE